jgi:endonuclease I
MVTNFAFSDTAAGKKVATCVYTGERVSYTPPFAWTPNTPFSREHTWCQSWMPSTSSLLPEYADQHHLFVVNQNSANAVRSNHPLGEVVNVTSSYLQGSYGTDAGGNLVYEPRESHKGNAARALLYMSLRYNGVNGLDWTFNRLNSFILPSLNEDPQDLQLLLQWHLQDPPDAEEIARNDYIQSIQGNRNPFIDRPTWTNFIDFSNLSYVSGNLSSINSGNAVDAIQMYISPMPISNSFEAQLISDNYTVAQMSLVAYNGQVVWSRNKQLNAGMNRISVSDLEIADGLYILVVEANGRVFNQRLIKSQPR